ncbi:LOW QUALITY PROTEIN: G patch domain-containing protein 1-like [Pollicipes pollicipes]|uniref:LOW QUALITY PROTEIN: G patch domain-containing protein 1-like n=1 Tax=Pollicipes pollicipes TaxID=41117 RepID=UPI0018851EC1|nr:LOW QUALITY PROTEIN: G patch domain-containing protein 1-like [Pollicipes pollicipes]
MDSDSDDDNVHFGTPLEPLEEGKIAAKRRPPALEDQTARDARGRQRFHGAFTGGFSAGFFNTVGSRDGFQPATFVSSRSSRAEGRSARPEDFMDDEDRGEHGIAPQRVQAKQDFQEAPTGGTKRRHPQFDEGPIPGQPVLEQLIKPDTVGVRILKSMGWRPGQGIGPRVTRAEKKQQQKVYGCARPPGADSAVAADSDSDSDSDAALREVLLAPDDSEAPLVRPKDDLFGLGYRGLERRAVLGPPSGDPTLRYRDAKGKLAVRGQAFGVGAFEEEDEDIYTTEDMSNYDFSESGPERGARGGRPAPSAADLLSRALAGFQLASSRPAAAPRYPPPPLPADFRPEHRARGSRFARYEKFLKLSAANRKEDYRLLLPASMTDWERGREVSEFGRAAQLFRPLAASLADRFVSAGTAEQERPTPAARPADDPAAEAARRRMFGPLTRRRQEWHPAPLLCRRFNVKNPYPHSSLVGTLGSGSGPARSQFEALDTSALESEPGGHPKSGRLMWDLLLADEAAQAGQDTSQRAAAPGPAEAPSQVPATVPAPVPAQKPPADLFKAIFDDSSSDSEAEPTAVTSQTPAATSQTPAAPPAAVKKAGFSLFDNVNLDELNSWRRSKPSDDEYGPKLPPRPPGGGAASRPLVPERHRDSDGGEWKEKSPGRHKKKKKHKKSEKKRKKSKKRASDDSDSSDLDGELLNKLREVATKKKKKSSHR